MARGGHIGELVAEDRLHRDGLAGEVHLAEVDRQQHAPGGALRPRLHFVIAQGGLAAIHPEVGDDAAHDSVGAEDAHAPGVAILLGHREIRRHPHGDDEVAAVVGLLGHIRAQGVGTRTHFRQHGVAHRLQRRARPGLDLLRLERAGIGGEIGGLHHLARVQAKALGGGDQQKAARLLITRRLVLERVALAAVFPAQIVDQTGEEEKECIEHDLSDIYVSGERSSHHLTPPGMNVLAVTRLNPSSPSCAATRGARTRGPMATTVASSRTISMA